MSFDDIDDTDVIDLSFASNNDISWSGGTLDTTLATSLTDGFSVTTLTDAAAPGSTPWTYNVTGVDLDFLKAGETITFSYTVAANDFSDSSATETISFTITGINDAPVANVVTVSYTHQTLPTIYSV